MGDIILSGSGGSGGGGASSSVDIHDGVDPTIKATVKDYTNSNPITVIAVDLNGDPVTSSGGDGAILDGAAPSVRATVFDLTNSNPLAVFVVDATGTAGTLEVNDSTAHNDSLDVQTDLGFIFTRQADRSQKTQITDGTRDGTVKAASTLPLLTDTAFVVTQRDPLPAGTNVIGHVINDANSGVDIGDVTINNAGGAAAVNIQDGGNSITVDGTVAIGAGSAVIGHVITDATSVTTVNNAAGASAVNIQDGGNSITVDNPTISVVGGGTEATAQRVTIANDSTGVLSVDDNGASLTVDGTVTTNQGTAGTNAQAWWTQIGDAITGPVKVTNSAPGGSDKALVVTTSPLSAFGPEVTPDAPAVVAVGVASALAVAVAARKSVILRNLSTAGQRISLNLIGGAAVLDRGITLYPLDAWEMGLLNNSNAQINAIASAAGASLAIQQFT